MPFDPLDPDYLLSVDKRDESMELFQNSVTNSAKPRKIRRTKEPMVKFYISKELRTRLKTLLDRQPEDSIVRTICERILNLKKVPVHSINYLGLSNDDYSKISYLNPDRIERLKGQKFTEKYIVKNTKVVIHLTQSHMFLEKSGERREVVNHFQKIIYFHPSHFGGKKEIRLNRIKHVNPEDYSISYEYEIPSFIDQISQRYYQYRYTNKQIVTIYGNESIVEWFLLGLKEVTKDAYWDHNLRYHQSIHKILTNLFRDDYTEREKNIFSEQYFKLVTVGNNNLELNFGRGEFLLHGYLEDNYKKPTNGATLWQSCMRYDRCQSYLNFYNEIPEVELSTLTEYGKIVARALVWTIDDNKYYDRIYYYNDQYFAVMENYLENYGYRSMRTSHCAGVNAKYELGISLSEYKFHQITKFPYVDTMRYYIPGEDILTNEEPSDGYYTLDSTDGGYSNHYEDETYNCAFCGDPTDADDLVTIDRGSGAGDYACECCREYSDAYQEYIRARDAVYCDYSESYVLDSDMVMLSDGSRCYCEHDRLYEYENDYGMFVLDQDLFEYYRSDDGEYYHPDDPQNPLNQVTEQVTEEETEEETEQETPQNTDVSLL